MMTLSTHSLKGVGKRLAWATFAFFTLKGIAWLVVVWLAYRTLG